MPVLQHTERDTSQTTDINVDLSITESHTTYTTVIFLGTLQETRTVTVDLSITKLYTTYTTGIVLGNSQEPTAASSPHSQYRTSDSSLRSGTAVAGVLGGFFFILLLSICCFGLRRRSSGPKTSSWGSSRGSSRSTRSAIRPGGGGYRGYGGG
jgi:hypothetical protein